MKRKLFAGFCLFALFFCLLPAVSMTVSAETEGDWEYSVSDNVATITAYTGSEKVVTIPEAIGGYKVTSIGKNAFYGNTSVESVVIPESVTSVGDSAFKECSSLTEAIFPDTLTSIGASAFASSKVKSITIPDSVTYIGAYAFADCTGLRTLTLGSGISEWGTDWGTNAAFRGCTLLTSMTISDGVSSIGSYAFEGCTLLMEVTLPSSVVTVGEGAFKDCELLDTAVVYGTVEASAFINCTSLANVTLTNVTEIGSKAFQNNTALKIIELPDGLTSIGDSAFQACTKLQEITIPDTVTYVGAYAFQACTQLESVTLGSGIVEWGTDWGDNEAFADCTKLSNVTIREGVSYLPNQIFRGCTVLETIEIPSSVVSIDSYAFENCQELTTVTFSEGLETIDNGAFKNCTVLSRADLPSTLLTIGNEAFRYTELRTVNVPDKVMTIGYYAFADCPALTSVSLGESVETWNTNWGTNGAFMNDTRLETLTIAEGVLSIGSYTFENCTALTAVDIPITVTTVGSYAFNGCISLTHVSILRGEIAEGAFNNCTALCDLSLERITTIGASAFANNVALYELNLPDTVTSIEARAFQGCVSLSELVLPESLTSLGAYAFADCTGLLTVSIGNNITSWGTDWGTNGAFMNDVVLRYATVDDGANSLGNMMFSGCTSLVGVYLPESVVSWETNTFENCLPEVLTIYGSGSKMQEVAETLGFSYSTDQLVIPAFASYTITIIEGENGIVAPSGDLVKPAGSSQTISVVPARGYLVESYIINGTAYDYLDQIIDISADVTVEVTFMVDPEYVEEYPELEGETSENETTSEETNVVRFTEEDASYAVANMYITGVLSGASDSYLSADDSITVGALFSLLYRLDGVPDVEWMDYDASVTEDDWYGKAVVWAVAAGILAEEDVEGFDADAELSRQELAVLVYRYAAYLDIPVGADTTGLQAYSDYAIAESGDASENTAAADSEEMMKEAVGNGETAEAEGSENAAMTETETADESETAAVKPLAEMSGDEVIRILAWAMENGLTYGTDGTSISATKTALCGQCSRLLTSFLADQLG